MANYTGTAAAIVGTKPATKGTFIVTPSEAWSYGLRLAVRINRDTVDLIAANCPELESNTTKAQRNALAHVLKSDGYTITEPGPGYERWTR